MKYGIQGGEWRRRWITALALLRAVGHVLDKIDAKTNPSLRKIIKKKWSDISNNKSESAIFWQFINKERNNILKEYKFHAGQGVTVTIPTTYIDSKTGEQTPGESVPTIYHYTINSGPYKGKEQKEVLNEAIEWWDKHLTDIEKQYAKNPN